MDVTGFMDRVIVQSTCVVALIALLVLVLAFARWDSLENRVPVVVSSISLLLYCVGVAYLLRGAQYYGCCVRRCLLYLDSRVYRNFLCVRRVVATTTRLLS